MLQRYGPVVVFVAVVGFWLVSRLTPRSANPAAPDHLAMPTGVSDAEERNLYLVPANKYTAADIRANGGLTAAQKYRGFRARHDLQPQSGDLLCPITRTKANPECTWIIDGKVYQFCCPPCIDEMIRLAKEQPELLKEPGDYRTP